MQVRRRSPAETSWLREAEDRELVLKNITTSVSHSGAPDTAESEARGPQSVYQFSAMLTNNLNNKGFVSFFCMS